MMSDFFDDSGVKPYFETEPDKKTTTLKAWPKVVPGSFRISQNLRRER